MHRSCISPAVLTAALLISPSLAMTDFFVSASGNDTQPGTSPSTAWASLTRVQQAQATLQPGDRVLFRAGDRFEGHLTLTCSGTLADPIEFGRYGAGAAPRLSASTAITGWTNMGNGVWRAPNPGGANHPGALIVDGRPVPLGREPDRGDPGGGYRTIDAAVGHVSITDQDLPASPDWTGAEAVIRTQRWILDRVRVQSHSGANLQLAAPGTFPYPIQPAFGFFVQDHPSALDQHLEWCFVPSASELRVMLDAGVSPSDYAWRTARFEHVVRLVGAADIRVQGLHLDGARGAIVRGSNVSRLMLEGCRLAGSAQDGVVLEQAHACTVADCVIQDCQNNGVRFAGASACSLEGSVLRRISLHAGMGQPTDGNSFGVLLEGNGNQVVQNRVTDVGYIGIAANGPDNLISQNYVARFCSAKDDGGAIYVSGYGPGGTQGTRVVRNLLLDGLGASAGAYPSHVQAAHGVYIDDFATDVVVAGNTAARCGAYGIFVHNGEDVTLRGNVCFGNADAQLAMIQDSIAPTNIRGAVVEGNVFCAREESALAAQWVSEQDDIAQFGVFDANAYVQLYRESGYLRRSFRSASQLEQVDSMDLAEWQGVSGLDLGSTASPFAGALPLSEAYTFLGFERIGNGSFSSSVAGWGCWIFGGGGNACTFDWNGPGVLDGGSARLSFSSFTGASDSVAFREFGAVVGGEQLLCTCSVIGAREHVPLRLELRQDGNPTYEPRSRTVRLETDLSREDHSVLIEVQASDANARLDLGIGEAAEAVWIDNVSVRAVAPNEAGLGGRMRLLTNPTFRGRVVVLDRDYVDAFGTPLLSGSQLRLRPMEGRVLIRP